MRILVIGESNSVMKNGWVQGLKDELGDSSIIENYSIGSTGVLNLIFHLDKVKDHIGEYDHIFVDHLINDLTFYIDEKNFYFDILNNIYKYLVSTGVPVTSVFYRRHTLAPKFSCFLEEIQDIIKNYPVEIFDTYQFLINQGIKEGDIHTQYKDSAHPFPEVSYKFGRFLGEVLNLNSGFKNDVSQRGYIDNDFVFPFHVLRVDSLANPYDVYRVKNSLVDIQLVRVEDELVLEIPAALIDREVIGVLFNASTADGFVSFDGGVRKILSNGFYGKGATIWARPLHSSKFSLSEKLNIKVERSASNFEFTEFTNKILLQGGARLDLSSLIIQL